MIGRVTAGITALVMSGCAEVRLYPVCYYDASPPIGASREVVYSNLVKSLQAALNADQEVKVSASPDGRWLIAWTTENQNASAAKVWPRVGCIGLANDSGQVKSEIACVNYVRQFIADKNYFTFGNARDVGAIDIWNESPIPGEVVHCKPEPL